MADDNHGAIEAGLDIEILEFFKITGKQLV